MSTSEDLILLSDILGYGSELMNARNRYSRDDASGRNASEINQAKIRQAYAEWMGRCPHSEHLCFADLTFFSDDRPNVRDALTIVIVPEGTPPGAKMTNRENYTTVLQHKYLADAHTMAPHSVFARGLPRIPDTEADRILTNKDLEKWSTRLGASDVDSQILFGHLRDVGRTRPAGQLNAPPVSLETNTLLTYEMNNFEKEPFNEALRSVVSNESILDQWHAWLSVWQEEADDGHQLSSVGGKPYWILAAPVGVAGLDDYFLVSCVFLAFDGGISREKVVEALRYVLLHLYEANANKQRHRGEVAGRNAALLPALHEVKNVIGAIVPQLSNEIAELLRDYFSDTFVSPLLTKGHFLDDSYVSLGLTSLISQKISQAAKIERLAQFSQGGMFLTATQTEITKLIEDFAQNVLDQSDIEISGDFDTAKCSKSYRAFLALAIMGAFRNAIHHSMIRNSGDGKMSVRVVFKGGTFVVSIENRCIVSAYQRDSEGKPSGTISALRGYARAYEANSNLVILCRIKEHESDGDLQETWLTEFPLPDLKDIELL